MNLKKISVNTSGHSEQLFMLLQWNTSEAADHYTVTVAPTVTGRSSSFIAPSTTVEIPVLYNQGYNISVVASNCAGNSTPAEITIFIMPCKLFKLQLIYTVQHNVHFCAC